MRPGGGFRGGFGIAGAPALALALALASGGGEGTALSAASLDAQGLSFVPARYSAGDEVLVALAEALKTSVRATDAVARWSGDEFVVLGPGTGTSPLELERRLRSHLSEVSPVPEEVWPARVSIGSATLVPWDDGDLEALLARAEQDMRLRRTLRRQSSERSRPRVASPPPPEHPVAGRTED